ncbi:MAG: MarR family winged helix-turn-helix transcriptional regulator [Asticcacaulis sp.]
MTETDHSTERGEDMKKSRAKDAVTRLVLEDSPSHLLHRVLQIALDIYNEEAGDGALTQRQYAVLKALSDSDGLSQTDLVRATGIDRSTLADLVARMLAKDLLVRERSATDARANLVRIAEAGRAALHDAHPRVLAADGKILSLLSPPKRDSFVKLLRKITTARESELAQADDEAAAAERAARKVAKKTKKKKAHSQKKAEKLEKKLKKLPMPPLSEGASGEAAEEHVTSPVVAA